MKKKTGLNVRYSICIPHLMRGGGACITCVFADTVGGASIRGGASYRHVTVIKILKFQEIKLFFVILIDNLKNSE